jgi:hypothetical protein
MWCCVGIVGFRGDVAGFLQLMHHVEVLDGGGGTVCRGGDGG